MIRVPNALRDFGTCRRSISLAADVRGAFEMAKDMCGAMHPDDIENMRDLLGAVERDVLAILKQHEKKGGGRR